MDEIEKAQADLSYLRGLTKRVAEARSPASIPLLWAAVTLLGFPIVDFAPHAAGWYWMVAAPVATCLTAVLAVRSRRRLGQLDRATAGRHLAHWVGLVAATSLAALSGRWGATPERATPTIVLLLLILGFWTGGVHMEKPLRWVSVLMLLGYLLMVSRLVPYPWTLLGLAIAAGLVTMALSGTRSDGD